MEDLGLAGGIPALMNELTKLDLIHKDCMTVTGKTVGENIENHPVLNYDVIKHVERLLTETEAVWLSSAVTSLLSAL